MQVMLSRYKFFMSIRLVLLSCILCGALSAGGQELVSLEDYLLRAQAENPQLQAFKDRYEAATQRIPQASSLPDPMFQVTSFVESVQTRTGPQENAFMLNQRIPWFGKLGSREKVASAEAEALWYAWQNQQLMLARTVSVAFFEYAYTEKSIRLSAEILDLLREIEPIVQTRVESGGDLNALLRLKVEIGKIGDRMLSLEQKRAIQSSQLRSLLALDGTDVLPWPSWQVPEAVSPDGQSLMAALESNNPSLAMLERKIASAEARRELARLDRYPDLTLGVNYIQIGDPVVNPMTPDAGQDPWGVTLAVNIPLWGGKYKAARAEALSGQRVAENEYEDRLNTLRSELGASLAALADANRRLALYGEELIGLAAQAVENSRAGYESGRNSILELIDSERSLLELQLSYWRAAADAWQQRIHIQTLVNQPIQ